ncbi:unnamed protein product, partial [Linum tenue]
ATRKSSPEEIWVRRSLYCVTRRNIKRERARECVCGCENRSQRLRMGFLFAWERRE